jgi:hypothetical protein
LNVFHGLLPSPYGVANHIEKLHRNFLWGRLGEEFKFHLVSWSKVCSSITEGGLGVQNFLMFNRALLGKRLWRYVHGRDRLGGELWWSLNLAVRGVGGVLMSLLGCM